MSYEALTNKYLSKLKSEIKDTLAAKNLDSTGQASQSLEVKGNQLLGADYLYYIDKGRSPGKFPPVANIQEWVRVKLGLQKSEAKNTAFLIGRKISRRRNFYI